MNVQSQSYLFLKDLTKIFDKKVVAVNCVTLGIEESEFFALLGPSGCGKTTTLRLIAGLERPTQGKIFLAGRDVTDLPPQNRDVAMVFQDYALYPHMSLFENIAYPLKVRGWPRKKILAKVREVAEHLMISELLDRLPSQVSGGQQQRAAVARALVHAPKVFLFDEPLSNLDAKLRLEARAFLKHLQKEVGVTTVYVTHDQAEAMAMADRIGVMFAGEVVQVGAPLELYKQPKTKDVAAFLGNPPMNILSGRFEPRSDGVEFVGRGFSVLLPGVHIREGQPGYLGFRPEHVRLKTSPDRGFFPGRIYAVQPLGSEFLITLQIGEETVCAKLYVEEFILTTGQIWFSVDWDKVHLFDAMGHRLSLP